MLFGPNFIVFCTKKGNAKCYKPVLPLKWKEKSFKKCNNG